MFGGMMISIKNCIFLMVILYNTTCHTSDNPLNHRSTLDSPKTLLEQRNDLSAQEKRLLNKMRKKCKALANKKLQVKPATQPENTSLYPDEPYEFYTQPQPGSSEFIPAPRPTTPMPCLRLANPQPITPTQPLRPVTPIPSSASPKKAIDAAANLMIFSDQVVEAAIFRLTQIPEEDTTTLGKLAAPEEISHEVAAITRTTPEYSPDASWIRINYDEEIKK